MGGWGAYLSNRAGGSRRAVLSSVVFPVLPYLAFFVLALPVVVILNDHIAHNIMPRALFVGLFAWVLAPGAALLGGGWPAQFLLSGLLVSRPFFAAWDRPVPAPLEGKSGENHNQPPGQPPRPVHPHLYDQ